MIELPALVEKEVKAIIERVGTPLYDLEGREVLITGGAGFLGSWFVAVFDYLNHHVFAQDKPVRVFVMDSGIASDHNNALYSVQDKNILFRNEDISTAHLEGSIDYIIHAAGIASPIYYRKFPIETIDGMVLGRSEEHTSELQSQR